MTNFLLQWNCRGLLSKWPECKAFFSLRSPTIIALQETWCRPSDNYEYHLRGYTMYRNDHQGYGRRRGGAALYISNSIPHTQINTPHGDINTVMCTIQYHNKNMDLINIYAPPYITATSLTNHLNSIITLSSNPILLMGDFNAHHTMWGNSHTDEKGTALEALMWHLNLIYLNDGSPTFHSLITGSTTSIDLTLCTPSLATQYNWSVDTDIRSSDHYPIYLTSPLPPTTLQWIPRWNFDRADWMTFTKYCEI